MNWHHQKLPRILGFKQYAMTDPTDNPQPTKKKKIAPIPVLDLPNEELEDDLSPRNKDGKRKERSTELEGYASAMNDEERCVVFVYFVCLVVSQLVLPVLPPKG